MLCCCTGEPVSAKQPRPERGLVELCTSCNTVREWMFQTGQTTTQLSKAALKTTLLPETLQVRVLGETYTPEDEEDSTVAEVTNVWVYQARYRVPLQKAVAGARRHCGSDNGCCHTCCEHHVLAACRAAILYKLCCHHEVCTTDPLGILPALRHVF